MKDHESSTVGRFVNDLVGDCHQTKVVQVVSQKFVVISWSVIDLRSVSRKLHQSLENPHIDGLPVPTTL